MGQQASLSEKIHVAICNSDKDDLRALTSLPEFTSEVLDTRMLVELIEYSWDSTTILLFAKLATDDQLSTLIATALLHNHVVSLSKLFSLMKSPSAAIEKHCLKELFYTACDRSNIDAVRDLIEYQCYDPLDGRPIIAVFRSAMARHYNTNTELLDLVLAALPLHTDEANYLLGILDEETRRADVKDQLRAILQKYVG